MFMSGNNSLIVKTHTRGVERNMGYTARRYTATNPKSLSTIYYTVVGSSATYDMHLSHSQITR